MAGMQGTIKVTSVLDAKADGVVPAREKGRTVPFASYKKGAGQRQISDNSCSGGSQQQLNTCSEDMNNEGVLEGISSDEDVILEDIPGVSEVKFPKDLISIVLDAIC